jgi:hypothetical protein
LTGRCKRAGTWKRRSTMLISGDWNPTFWSCRSLPPTRRALTRSHNVCEDLSGAMTPARLHIEWSSYAPMFPVMTPHTNPESSRATATTALFGPFLAASLR